MFWGGLGKGREVTKQPPFGVDPPSGTLESATDCTVAACTSETASAKHRTAMAIPSFVAVLIVILL
jgi:hypothetical protein